MNQFSVFDRVRDLRIQIAELKRDYDTMMPSVKSPKLDGLPKSGRDEKKIDWIDKRNSLAARIEEKTSELKKAQAQAEAMMRGMPHDLFRFCQCYYIGAYDIDHVCVVLEFSRRTFYNRQKELVEYLEGAAGRE